MTDVTDKGLKITQLAISEFKVDTAHDFCLASVDNDIILGGNSHEFHILEMMYSVEMLIPLPFNIKNVQVSQDKPLVNLISPIDLVRIYESANVMESQELSLDPLYVYECSVEPAKARLLQADLVRDNRNSLFCCVLNSYGSCDVLQKDVLTHEWKILKTNLNRTLMTNVFPSDKSSKKIKNFTTFKKLVDTYTITAFVWSYVGDKHMIYVATAVGYVVALKFSLEDREFVELFRCKTSLERITYMATRDNLLIVTCNLGQIALLTIDPLEMTLTEKQYLWSKKDRMSCRKAVIDYSQQWESYFIVCSKGAHILAYRLDNEGNLLSNSTLYTKGIKITGLENISAEEYLVTSILGIITYVNISCPSNEELALETKNVEHNIDTTNLQILGVVASKWRSLWTFFLSRNKDYTHQSKNSSNTAFTCVCKINNQNSLIKLINLNINTMDNAQDLVMSINLDIINSLNADTYQEFMNVSRINIPKNVNDAYLQKVQIKLLIVRNMAKYQMVKYKNIKQNTQLELHFLESIVQMIYIILRLQHLQAVQKPDVKLSSFQELSVACMQSQFCRLLNAMMNNEDEENNLKNTRESSAKVLSAEYEKYRFGVDRFTYKPERCEMCDAEISVTTFDKCREGHDIKRCTISFIQLPMLRTNYCPHCYALVTDKDVELMELFPPNENIKCTFCRFLIKHDNV